MLAYKGAIFLWFLGGIIDATVMCLLWHAVYTFSPESVIGGFTYPQMMMYVLLIAVVNEVIYSDTISTIDQDVRHGLIGMRLMKPINYRAQLGFSSFGNCLARMAVIGVPMVTAAALVSVFGFGFTGIEWYNVLLFIPAVLIAALMNDTLGFLFGQLAFRTQAMFGVNSIMSVVVGFLSGQFVPITLFPQWAQTALSFTPFPTILSFPVRLFMGVLPWQEVLLGFGISILWLIVLNVLGELLYKGSVRHVVVFGG